MGKTKFDFSGKRVLVSGSTSGIGAATVRLFANSGAKVVIHGRNADRAAALQEEIRSTGGVAIVALGSLDSDTGTAGVVQQVETAFGGIDILVSNAGDSQPYSADWFDVSTEDWLSTYNSNVGGAVRLAKAFVPAMRSQRWGRIILIGSSSYYLPIPDFPTYGPAKAALANVMVNLTKVLGGTGVTVNMISPGSVLTETMQSNLLPMAHGEGWSDVDPLVIEHRLIAEKWPNAVGRMGRPEEIAATVAFAASEEAAFMTGAHIRVNGGEHPSLH